MEVFRVIEIEFLENGIKCSDDCVRSDFTFIDFLVAVLTEPAGSVEHIPGLKESVVTKDIYVVDVELINLVVHNLIDF